MKAVSVERLEEGMILARTVTNEQMVIILSEGTKLDASNIARLKLLDIPAIYIKDDFDLSKNFQQASAVIKRDSAFTHDFENVSKLANEVFDSLTDGGEPKETTKKFAAQVLPMADNSGSIDYLFGLGHMNNSIALHSVRVSILSGIIAKWMHFSWEEIRTLVSAAVLHDAGKIKFPENIIGKLSEELEGEDLQTYIGHCKEGFDLLKRVKFDEPIPTVALSHHERMNGSGFPNALHGDKIHPFARIVAVADAYDNLITEREGSVKRTPFDAVNFFIQELYSNFDPVVCIPLLTRIKDSLIGSTVKLSDGRKGQVAFYPNDFSALPIISFEDGSEENLNHGALKIIQYNAE